MSWRKRLVEKWKKFVEDIAKSNEQTWKGQEPSCCAKKAKKEE